MKPETETQFQELVNYASSIKRSWEEGSAIDWGEADSLIKRCSALPDKPLKQLPVVKDILSYAHDNDDWDSGLVGNWPGEIISEIHAMFGIAPDLKYADVSFDRDEDSDSRWWAMIDGSRMCYIVGTNRTYMAEVDSVAFGPAKSKLDAARLAAKHPQVAKYLVNRLL